LWNDKSIGHGVCTGHTTHFVDAKVPQAMQNTFLLCIAFGLQHFRLGAPSCLCLLHVLLFSVVLKLPRTIQCTSRDGMA
jgi:hypothetical protein